jgi:hypothetical protein
MGKNHFGGWTQGLWLKVSSIHLTKIKIEMSNSNDKRQRKKERDQSSYTHLLSLSKKTRVRDPKSDDKTSII